MTLAKTAPYSTKPIGVVLQVWMKVVLRVISDRSETGLLREIALITDAKEHVLVRIYTNRMEKTSLHSGQATNGIWYRKDHSSEWPPNPNNDHDGGWVSCHHMPLHAKLVENLHRKTVYPKFYTMQRCKTALYKYSLQVSPVLPVVRCPLEVLFLLSCCN